MTPVPVIRPFQPADEAAVRRICFATALFGQSLAPVLDDVELVSEALCGYYVRCEPELLFVADAAGAVAGYVSGCRDTARYSRRYAWRIAPRLAALFLRHGHWRRRATWRLLGGGLRAAGQWSGAHQAIAREYPAHGHLNLDARFQRQGLGTRLLGRLLAELRARGVPAIHISAASAGGQAFFTRAGFVLLTAYPAPLTLGGPPRTVQVMGLRLQ